ncbi:MAG: methyltransferase domain-containing protein [Rhodospirillaceae bacterium]
MWLRFADMLRCPCCNGSLELQPFEARTVPVESRFEVLAGQRGVLDERFNRYAESGVLLCEACKVMFPVLDGLPVLLCYDNPLRRQFTSRYGSAQLQSYAGYRFPEERPASGEREVMASFSKEWLDYQYDGVIWEMSYEDHETRFLQEMGSCLRDPGLARFLEVGCGLGITTHLAHTNSGADAVGIDLSLAVWKASRHYRSNPFLHFAQASVFAMPFAARSFDAIYSRGVLHHTASTRQAFAAVAQRCREGGAVYIWVYGTGSIRETVFRRVVYGLERVVRPALSTSPNSVPARTFLAAMGGGYVLFNGVRRMLNPTIQPLNLARGIHAARDRFTPKYAHRHDVDEVKGWFRDAGFEWMEVLDWKAMPPADHDDFRRNVGVRGRLARAPAEAI